MIGAVTGIGITLVMVLLGVAIRCGKATWLIAGYNTSSAKKKAQYDVGKLCKAVGNLLFAMGGVSAIATIAGFLMPGHVDMVITAGAVAFTAVTIAGVIYLNTGNRVMKK